jgi:hypothetical protein
MKKYLTIIFISLTLVTLGQKTKSIDKDKERIDKVCDTFMKLFAEDNTTDAINLLRQNTLMSPSTIDTLQVTIASHIKQFFPPYGKMLSAEFIIERKIKDFIAKRFYILKLENYYLKFEFTLYRAKNGWSITNFKYDEEVAELYK